MPIHGLFTYGLLLFWHQYCLVSRMQHIRFLLYVDAVARCGSFRGAAERLHVDASAVNRRIQDLEAELGCALFDRLPRGVRLSAEGELFLGYARRRQADLEVVRGQIEDLRGKRMGSVKLAVSQALAHTFLPAAMRLFQSHHPGVVFDVKVLDHHLAIDALGNFEADLGIIFNPPAHHGIDVLVRMPCRIAAVVSENHPLANHAEADLKSCFEHPTVLPDHSLAGRAILERLITTTGLTPRVVLSSNSFELMYGYIRQSNAVGFQVAVHDFPSDGLRFVSIAERRLHDSALTLLAVQHRVLPPAAAEFAQLVAQQLNNPTTQSAPGAREST